MDNYVKILTQEVLYQGFFRLERFQLQHRLFDGRLGAPITREALYRGPAAAVVLYDAGEDVLVFVEQFRIGAFLAVSHGGWMLELVAGILEPDEAPEAVVRREALEEAGCTIGELLPIGSYLSSPASTPERLHLYCGQVDARTLGGIHGLAEEGEDIRVVCLPAEQVLTQELFTGRICSATPLLGLLWFAQQRAALRARWG